MADEERELAVRESQYEQENRGVALENERLHEQGERLAREREMFEREALKLK